MPITTTTDLPDEDQPQLGNGVEDEIAIDRESAVSNYGDVRIQIRETGQSAWDSSATGFDEAVLSYDTLETIFTGREDGEEYEVRARTETEHVQGNWTAPVTITAQFPGPTDLQHASDRFDTLTFTYTDNADNEQEVRLERNTGSGWETVATEPPNTTTLEDQSPAFYETVEYRVVQSTEHTAGTSDTVTVTAARSDDGLWVELARDDQYSAIAPHRIASANLDLTHTALSGWEARISPVLDGIRDFQLGEAQFWIGDEQLIRGEINRTPEDAEGISIVGDGPAAKLLEDTDRATYTGRAWAAIDDYADKTPADSWTVHEPYVRSQGTDEQYLDVPTNEGFDAVVQDPGDDVPLYWDVNTLRPAPVCWPTEAENGTNTGTIVTSGDTGEDYSNFEAVELSPGTSVDISFTTEHRIPADEIDIRARMAIDDLSGSVFYYLDNEQVYELSYNGVSDAPGWRGAVVNGPSNDLQPGTHTVRIKNGSSGSGTIRVDLIAPFDERYQSQLNFDNTVDTTDYTLSGPERYPESVQAKLPAAVYWHVSKGHAELSIDDTSGQQAIALSNDGESFVEAANTDSHTVDFDAEDVYGDDAIVRLTLGRYAGTNSTKTPTEGDAPQTVTGLQLYLDTDDLPVLDGFEGNADSWLANMQDLHEAADMRFTVDHRADGLHVESYRRGDPDVLQAANWTTNGRNAVQFERDTTEYFNQVTVYAAPESDLTSRTLRDSAEVDRVGTTKPRSRTSSITDSDELTLTARQALLEGVAGDRISGSIEIVPTYIKPGYPYEPPAFDGERANLESVSISLDNGGLSGSLQFGARRDLVAALQSQGGR